VECRNDGECTPGKVCDTVTEACGECAAGKTQNCNTSPNGPICLPSDKCGCAADTDCGNATSGKVCEISRCQTGCRGTGGNGCPAGQSCTSKDGTVGQCQNVADGGSGDGGQKPDGGTVGDGGTGDGGTTGDGGGGGGPDGALPPSGPEGTIGGGGCHCGGGAGLLAILPLAFTRLRRRRRA
jgi:hypothetical protein